jgi:uncharacterized protein YbaR (Trm112 family)
MMMNKLREAIKRLESQDAQSLEIDATVEYDVTPPSGEEVTIEVIRCPACHGTFGVDSTYLDQVDTTVICPMCVQPLYVAEANVTHSKEPRAKD